MNRRLALVLTGLSLIGVGLAGTAAAAAPERRHTVCIGLAGDNPTDPDQPGYCVSWEDPAIGR